MKRAFISMLIPLVLITACSSSDNSFTDPNLDPPPPPPPGGFAITPGNGLQVSQVAYQSVVTSGDMAGLTGGTGLTAGGGNGFSKPGIDAQIGGLLGRVMQTVPLPPIETICGLGPGTFTVAFDVVDPLVFATGALSAGDTILVEYDNCDEGFGEILDGTIDFTVDAFTGDILANLFDVTMTMNLVDFQVTLGTDVMMSNGDATATLNNLAAPFVSASVTGNMMTTDMNSSSEVLTSYSSAQTVDAGLDPAPFTMTASGTLNSSQLDGAVSYSTPTPFTGFDLNYPSAGVLLVASGNSSARVIAVNDVDVRIEIYSNADGSGTPDETILTTWAELAGA